MSILPLLEPGSLYVWLVGMCLVVVMFYAYARIKRGTITNSIKVVCLALFALSVIVFIQVPKTEINKAITFANEVSGVDEQVTNYEDISYGAKDSYRLTSMSGEQREEFLLFYAPEEVGPVIVDGKELVLKPQRGTAWILLSVFLIGSLLIYFQAPKKFLPFISK